MNGCKDLTKEVEWNEWYDKVHLPDVLAQGVFATATRFKDTNAELKPGETRYSAVYETSWPDVLAAQAELGNRLGKLGYPPERRRHPSMLSGMFAGYRTIHQVGEGRGKTTKGILLVLSNCKEASKEVEFNRWYSEEHLPAFLETKLYHAATRYEAAAPKPGQAKYVAIYETESEDAGKTLSEAFRVMNLRRAKGEIEPNPTSLEVVVAAPYKRVMG